MNSWKACFVIPATLEAPETEVNASATGIVRIFFLDSCLESRRVLLFGVSAEISVAFGVGVCVVWLHEAVVRGLGDAIYKGHGLYDDRPVQNSLDLGSWIFCAGLRDGAKESG